MGTRATIHVVDGDGPREGATILSLYIQSDGYPSGLGATLKTFCEQRPIVNGMNGAQDETRIANGIGCFAAFLVAHLKERAGGTYVTRHDADGQDYQYTITGPTRAEVEAAKLRTEFVGGAPVTLQCTDHAGNPVKL